jgi:hypothetical protein
MEACDVDAVTGLLACTTWAVQTGPGNPPANKFGNDALLYFDFLYGFGGIQTETTTASSVSRNILAGNIERFPVLDLTTATGDQIIDGFQSANVNLTILRAYYKNLRLLSYIYVVGGFTAGGPTDTVERHLQ